mgnify:CR=1 FL=1
MAGYRESLKKLENIRNSKRKRKKSSERKVHKGTIRHSMFDMGGSELLKMKQILHMRGYAEYRSQDHQNRRGAPPGCALGKSSWGLKKYPF